MKLSDIKHLVEVLESRGIDDSFDLKFAVNLCPNGRPDIESFVLDKTDNDHQRFDIGHSDKIVSIFTEIEW